MKILIGGGSGFIGKALTQKLRLNGHHVQIISRQSGNGNLTWDQLKNGNALPPCDAVVNLSGEYILSFMRRWNSSYKDDIWNSRVGTNKLLAGLIASAQSKPKVWVSGTAEGYYPRSDGNESFDESYILTKPNGFFQKLCYEWEKSASIPEEHNVRQCLIRTGVVLGRTGGLIQQSYWPFYFGLGGVIGSGKQQLSWIHISDIVNLFVHAIENENVSGPLNGTAPNPCTMYEFTKAYGKALNRPTFFPVPEFIIKMGVGKERAPFMLEGSRVLPNKVLESGFQYKFGNIEDAMNDIVN